MRAAIRQVLFAETPFSPRQLFAAGEQGAWYDPSDLTTMFTDAAGTTPVTGVEQPVGLILDKSKSGVGTNGAARYNLLTYTEEFNNAAWTLFNSTLTTNATTAPNGTITADLLVPNTTGNRANQAYRNALTAGQFSIYAKAAGKAWITFDGNSGASTAWFDLQNGVTGTVAGGYTATITNEGNGWFRCSITTATSLAYFNVMIVDGNNTKVITANSVDGVYLWGADLRLAADAAKLPLYQPITSSWAATIPGNHASQTTLAARPVLSARVNLLTYSEDFSNGAWGKDGASVVAGKLTEDSSNGRHRLIRDAPASSLSYTYSVKAKYAGRAWLVIALADSGGTDRRAWFNVQSGAVGTVNTNLTASISSAGSGWYICKITVTSAYSNAFPYIFLSNADGGLTYQGDGSSGIELGYADLRVANDGVGLPPYQRVAAATDYDTVGFPPYLSFDGTDDCLFTGNIDFTATDKMTVWAGVRKLSDAAIAVLAETRESGNSNNYGTFFLTAPNPAGAAYNFASRGTLTSPTSVSSGYAAPISNVLTGSSSISADQVAIRINSVEASAASGDQGSGNYGNFPLYIGRRVHPILQYAFSGRIYSLIVRGAQSTTSQTTQIETWVNQRTKAY